jgi:superfamily II DNA helicase RecQ
MFSESQSRKKKFKASEEYVTIYSPGLKQELLDLRTAIGEKNHKPGKDVLSDASVASITKFKPITEEDLSYSGKLTADQFARLSDQILAIVRKYKNEGIESIIIRTNTFKG